MLRPPSCILGVLLLKGGRGWKEGGKGEGGERGRVEEGRVRGWKGKGKGNEGKGRGRPSGFAPPKKFPSYATARWNSVHGPCLLDYATAFCCRSILFR